MKSHIIKLVVLFVGLFSCTNDQYHRFQWDDSRQQEEFKPVNPGAKSSSFAIDSNMISFAVPNLVGTIVTEHPPLPDWGGPNAFSPHFWTISLIMAEGTNVTSLSPIITLSPNTTITQIHSGEVKQVDYTGIAEVGVHNFRHQIDFVVIASDGSTVKYKFLAIAIGDEVSCANCP